jgi:hypothetical protein
VPRFDWKDSLLIAVGFVACIATATFVERALGIQVNKELLQVLVGATILGFPALRRRFFGEPDLPEPRRGFFPSLSSVLGLLGTIFGMALLAIFGPRLLEAPRTPPDYSAQPAERIPALEGLEIVPLLGEQPDTEKMAEEEREIEQFEKETEAYEQEVRSDWLRQEAERLRTTRWLSALGLGLVALGAFAAYVRYPQAGK